MSGSEGSQEVEEEALKDSVHEKKKVSKEPSSGVADNKSLQLKILQWRYSGELPKTIAGFWMKGFIEFVILIGIPVWIFILSATSFIGVSLSNLPVIPVSSGSRITAWFILTGVGWAELRCILTEGYSSETILGEQGDE